MRHFNTIRIALTNVKNRFFHTFLSILGMVIGVAALVGTLSLIDGMESFARAQISSTTSLQALMVRTKTYKEVNGLRLKKEQYAYLTYPQCQEVIQQLTDSLEGYVIESTRNRALSLIVEKDSSIQSAAGLVGQAMWRSSNEKDEALLFGRNVNLEDVTQQRKVCVINGKLAKAFESIGKGEALVGKTIQTDVGELEIVGVGKKVDERGRAKLVHPISLLSDSIIRNAPPSLLLRVHDVEKVLAVKEQVTALLADEFPTAKADFDIFSYENRLKQADKGFLVFRIVMGMIVGLSVLVGGIGVMNVMLISVSERTTEIGISKAMGAKRKDIFVQFLAESITISSLGSLLGLILGILATMAFVPIIKSLAEIPFEAAYTLNTLGVIGFIALLVGIVFGTYPAIRASKLDPVEAMRRE